MLDKMSSVKDVNEDIDYMDEIGNSLTKKKKKGYFQFNYFISLTDKIIL